MVDHVNIYWARALLQNPEQIPSVLKLNPAIVKALISTQDIQGTNFIMALSTSHPEYLPSVLAFIRQNVHQGDMLENLLTHVSEYQS